MKRPVAILAVVGVIAIGLVGYDVGVRTADLNATQRAAVEALIEDNVAARPPPAPIADLSDGQRATVTAMIRDALPPPPPAATPLPPAATPLPPGTVKTAGLSEDERAEVEGIVRDLLIANPEMIRDAINELQRREDEAEQIAQAKAIDENSELIFTSAADVVLGNPEGNVTLVEFFDYNCGYCRRAHADMKELIETDPDLRVVLKEFPVLGDGSIQAAHVSMAVLMTARDKYAAFHDALISEPGQVDGARALAVAEELGIDPDALTAEIDSDAVSARIDENYTLAGELNLTGTPSYVTQKEVIVGAIGYDGLKTKIDDARACITASC